ncbi:MAG TPA: TolC family protein, partial [Chthonomonadaceae bacterium]|nr:TolC family protein [Chthonomonadaceae bacterium]
MRLPHSLAWMLALIHLVSVSAFAQQTPPIPPKVVDVTVPPPVTVPGVTAPGDVPNRPLTADEAARIALRHQYQVTEARAGFNAAQGRTQQQKSALGPSVNVSAGYIDVQTLSSPSGTGGGTSAAAGLSTTGFNGDVTLRQLIFDFNHTRDLVRQSQALERSAAQNLTNVQTNVVFQVKQAYYSYAQSIALEAVDEDDLKNRNSQRDLARARLNSGLGLPSDVVAAETAVDEAITTLNQARANVTLARITLALDMGIDPRTPIVIGTTGEPALG